MAIEITICEKADATVVQALGELMPQLSQSAPPPTEEEITEIINHDAATLLLAREGEKYFRFYDLDSFSRYRQV